MKPAETRAKLNDLRKKQKAIYAKIEEARAKQQNTVNGNLEWMLSTIR
jgi:hypothetical protein